MLPSFFSGETLITFVSFVVVLGILVFFHELGHYWVARRNGIIVDEFGMGYPPRLIKLFTYDGTDFTINLIPFGGFARMRGEDAADMGPGTFNGASRGGRAATLIAGPAMNALLAIILFAISFMDGFPAPAASPQVLPNSSAELAAFGVESGDILLTLDDRPIYTTGTSELNYRILNRSTASSGDNDSLPVLVVSREGELVSLTLPAETTANDLIDVNEYQGVLGTQISLVEKGSPADAANLQNGDLFYAVDEEVVTDAKPLTDIISRHVEEHPDKDQAVSLTVMRDQEWITVQITPRSNPPEGQGALGVRIGSISQMAALPFGQSLWQGVVWTFDYFRVVLQLPFMLLTGDVSPAEAELTGPVGIAGLVGGAVSATIETGYRFPIWRLSAILSAALAITNMLPLPALDGGRLLFILIETIRGRRINPEREGMVHMLGFMLLLGLIVIITVRDISATREGIDWLSILGQ
ncbi:MAG: RIP metalloprotease RseP [Chloroflexota bacterium]